MKAKVIKTGEIVDVYPVVTDGISINNSTYKEFTNGTSSRTFYKRELDFDVREEHIEKNIDWEQRRFELTKAALNGMLAHSRNGHGYHPKDPHMNWHDAIAEESIEIADSVIAKLKEE